MQKYLQKHLIKNCSIEELIWDIRRYFLLDYFRTRELLHVLITRLMCTTTPEILQLIKSDDSETFKIGVQLLFGNYIDTYNLINNSEMYDSCLHHYPRYLTENHLIF